MKKKIVLPILLLSAITLSAQTLPPIKTQEAVGINTSEPRATLDVNGDVRIQTIPKDESADKLVVVGKGNVISSRSLSGITGGSVTVGGTIISGAYGVGREYTCNDKNKKRTIWLTEGAITCKKYNNRAGANFGWFYSGLGSSDNTNNSNSSDGNMGRVYFQNLLIGESFTSGFSRRAGSYWYSNTFANYSSGTTAPLRVVDDSQYIP